MCKDIKIFPSLNAEENQTILQQLYTLNQRNQQKDITYTFLGNVSFLLDDYMSLPAIITDEGDRIEGIEGVKHFLDNKLAHK